MGRRRKTTEDKVLEGLLALAPILALGWIFSPQFRAFAIMVVCLALASLFVWAGYKLLKHRSNSDLTTSNCNQSIESPVYNDAGFEPPKRTLTISEQLRKIDWFQFEKLIESIYRQRGYSVQRLGGANPDGGVDLIIESTTEKYVVQCKHWRKWSVGVRQIREFLGTLTDSNIPNGIFITLNGYSGDAKQLADKHGIQILNETDVIRMLEESGLVYSQEISELLSDSRKFCPKCEREMVLRTARLRGNQFWGCSNYPSCKFVLNLE